jgi:S-adenosylmethionine hydrolase
MIALFTDFGLHDPYVGQLHAVLAQQAPGVPVIDLFHAAPNYDIRAAAYLLPAYAAIFPPKTIFVCVVDPGVGSARRAVLVRADGRWYVGPDNGLFHVLAQRAGAADCHEILWRPAQLSASFHGRDLFAPVAAMLARGETPQSAPTALTPPPGDWPDDLAQVVYIDHYGNAITGVRAARVDRSRGIRVGGRVLAHARTFSAIPTGQACWYENANGLVEFAVNRSDAAQTLGLHLGDSFEIEQ